MRVVQAYFEDINSFQKFFKKLLAQYLTVSSLTLSHIFLPLNGVFLMKYLVLLYSLMFIVTSTLFSQTSQLVETGKQPLHVFQHENVVHVLTNTIDINFNGLQDEGDIPSKWFRYNAETKDLIDSTTFAWRSYSFPIRVGIDKISHKLYIPTNDAIAEYDLNTGQITDSLFLEIPVRSISTNGNTIGVVDKNSASQTAYKISKYTSGTFIQQALRCGINKEYIAFINEGAFGSSTDDSYLTILSEDSQLVFPLGKGANHIFEYDNKLYITMNGSHEIVVFSLSEMKIEKKISTQTTGFDGPRESIITTVDSTLIYTTTYAGDVRVFSLESGEMLHTIAFPEMKKVESIAYVKDYFYITRPMSTDFDDPDKPVNLRKLGVIRNNQKMDVSFDLPYNPSQLLTIDSTLFIVFNRVDKNFNTIQDPEDSEAWIYKYDIRTLTDTTFAFANIDSVNLGWSSLGFPTRCSFDLTKKFLYVACNDTIRSYTTKRLELVNDYVTPFKTSYFTQTGENEFFASIRSKENYGVKYNQIVTGKFPQSTATVSLSDGSEAFVVNNEGDFSASATNGSLTIYRNGETNTIDIGNTANHFLVKDDIAYVTMNGSHEVVKINLLTKEVEKRFAILTSGFSGPRETVLLDNTLYTTAYSGDIFTINLGTDEVKKEFTTSGIPEGLTIVTTGTNTSLWTALAYKDASYSSDDRVEIFNLSDGTSVVEGSKYHSNELSIVGNKIRYNTKTSTSTVVTIHTLQGEQVFTVSSLPTTGEVAIPSLPSGSYIASLRHGQHHSSLLFTIIR